MVTEHVVARGEGVNSCCRLDEQRWRLYTACTLLRYLAGVTCGRCGARGVYRAHCAGRQRAARSLTPLKAKGRKYQKAPNIYGENISWVNCAAHRANNAGVVAWRKKAENIKA